MSDREHFEAWLRRRFPRGEIHVSNGEYEHQTTQHQYEAFVAGMAVKQAKVEALRKRSTGWVIPKDRYAVPVLFNPYTGEPRDVRDVQSDPQGILIAPPGSVEMLASKSRRPAKLWLWKNFVDGKPEYWAFDNPFPTHMDCGDPQTLGEPCGYALFKESRNGRPDVPDDEVLQRVLAARPGGQG